MTRSTQYCRTSGPTRMRRTASITACTVAARPRPGQVLQRLRGGVLVEHGQLGGRVRVADADPRGEAVALRLGQRVGAVHLDRVLRGDHEERAAQPVGDAVHRDLVLGHALQQRGLGLGRGAVDLVRDHDVREHRPGAELELLGAPVVDRHAGDVAGQQVRGELDPAHRAVDRDRQRLGQRRLADARHVLDQEVPLGEQRDERDAHDVRLAHEHVLDVRGDPVGELRDLGKARRGPGRPPLPRSARTAGVGQLPVVVTRPSSPPRAPGPHPDCQMYRSRDGRARVVGPP